MLSQPESAAAAIFAASTLSNLSPAIPGGDASVPVCSTSVSALIGTSSAKRAKFCQSSATSRSILAGMVDTGALPRRRMAADSPPRICGLKVFFSMP